MSADVGCWRDPCSKHPISQTLALTDYLPKYMPFCSEHLEPTIIPVLAPEPLNRLLNQDIGARAGGDSDGSTQAWEKALYALSEFIAIGVGFSRNKE